MNSPGQRTWLWNRRQWLQRAAHGFGWTALLHLLAEDGRLLYAVPDPQENSRKSGVQLFAPRSTHFPPTARSVIFLYMDGGPSQVDTFDPKPLLEKYHGKPFPGPVKPTQFNNVGMTLASPWKFRRYGSSGIAVSDLFPHVARCVDDLCIIRSMTSKFSEHTNANYFLHTGHGQSGRPSMGAWTVYGLGTMSRDLPGFVVLASGMIPPGGIDNFGSGFLPAAYQGTVFGPGHKPIADLHPPHALPAHQQSVKRQLLEVLDRRASERWEHPDPLEATIANYELAFRMQTAVPELLDLSRETVLTQRLYGLDEPRTAVFGRQCLIARRLIERGVRFVELLCPNVGHDRWDQHSNLKKGHEDNAVAVDKPIAGLLRDLKQRGLLETTLVLWAGEFGRTPMAQGRDGRDHNPYGFSIWLAGGGVRGGITYGATDEFGYHAVENKVDVHDLHATILHLLGIDHTRLTFRFGGRDMRLTDVFGNVIEDILCQPKPKPGNHPS